ncbi:UNVERIFIED_CONTAM: hypothetical protein GTU68_040906 [Idotea baltica]|nr:hypothetical protein [Idotea baltica]
MLGNFSFGDYFKKEAIHNAWELLTSPEWLNLPKEKLLVTIYITDDEAFNIWTQEIGLNEDRIIRIDNFWAMGDTGPCGPSTEIFYDHGEHIWGGPPGSPEEDGDRFIEIWNIVFMQFNRTSSGDLRPLPAPSVDTGMGLERISAVLQHVHSNYDIDLFQNLLDASAQAIGCLNDGGSSLKVVADHIRSCSFLIADGVTPSNEGRGYVLRRIIRRACRHGHKLGSTESFFYRIVPALVSEMGEFFPELIQYQEHIGRILKKEEEQFTKTLDQGLKILEQDLLTLKGSEIPGRLLFKLYDTYGFPVDLTGDVARERGLTIDEEGFEQEMQYQRSRARLASNFTVNYDNLIDFKIATLFLGYESTNGEGQIVALFENEKPITQLESGKQGVIVLNQTTFYAESGGQVGDSGFIETTDACFEVHNTTKMGHVILHHGSMLSGSFELSSQVRTEVSRDLRRSIASNHSATHLLHAALREIIGSHVQQKGSYVDSQRLRFDFSHFEALTEEQLFAIEKRVNIEISRNTLIKTLETDIETAKANGAVALFGEKYSETVRMLTMGDEFSIELCGGTHAGRTGDIGLFKIISESGVAAGVRRIEAITGLATQAYLNDAETQLKQILSLTKSRRDNILEKIETLVQCNRSLEKQVEQLKSKTASSMSNDLIASAVSIQGIKVLSARIDGQDAKALMVMVDQLKNKLGSAVVLLGGDCSGKVVLVAGITQNLNNRLKAGDLIKEMVLYVDGKGGGRADMAQGGGSNIDQLDSALQKLIPWVEENA